MTPQRTGSFIRPIRSIAAGTLAAALLGSPLLMSCGGSNNAQYEEAYDTRRETAFGQGVRTYITETAPGTFKITDEVSVGADSAVAIVRYYDGHTDTLNAQSARALIDKEVINNPQYVQGHSGLGSALLWGGMGYFLGRSMGGGSSLMNFRNRYDNQRAGVYASPTVFNRSGSVMSRVDNSQSSRTVRTARPAGGRSGFGMRSRSGGFGG